MSRKVFFSFHFKRDAWRAGQVRNCNLLADEDEYGFIDGVEWEKVERQGDAAIERWINDQLKYTSVTAVLIGAETSERDWVEHEVRQSWERGNGIVGIRIHNIKDEHGKTDIAGASPLDTICLEDGTPLSRIFKTYDWVAEDGRTNLGRWVEEAFQIRTAYKGKTTLRIGRPGVTETGPRSTPHIVAGPTVIRSPAPPWSAC